MGIWRPSSQCSDPSGELGEVEWFGQIVVGARIEAADLVAQAIACRQHQNRGVVAARAQLGAEIEPVSVRQANVNHECVVAIDCCIVAGIDHACLQVDGVALFGESSNQDLAESSVIFDHQQAHWHSLAAES